MSKEDKTKYVEIFCKLDGVPKSKIQPRIPFQYNGKTVWVPVNVVYKVPSWVYDIWVNSVYNPAYDPLKGIAEEHIEGGLL